MDILSSKSYYFNPHAFPLFIIGLFIFASGVFVFIKLKDKHTGFSFLIMSISGSIWFLGTMMGYLSKKPDVALFWFKIDNIGVVFLSSTVYAFVVSFLKIYGKRKTLIFLGYIASTILSILILTTNLMNLGVQKFFWGFFPKWGILSFFFLPFFTIYMFLSFLELVLCLFSAKDLEIKKQILFFFLAFGFAYTSSIDYFATYGIPIYPLSFISMGVYFLFIAYAITKKHLMDISVVISKSIAYALTMIILGIGYLLLVIFYKWYVSSRIDSLFILLSIAYGIFVGFSFERFRVFLQTTSDKVFLKGRYGFRDSLTYFVNRLFRVVSLEDLRKVFEDARVEVVELKYLKLVVIGVDDKPKELTDEVMEKITKRKKIVFSYELKEQHKNIAYFVPCLSDDHLLAVIIVGEKLSENSFKEEEIETFRVLAPLVATAISRIKPFEDAIVKYKTEKERADLADKIIDRINNYATLGEIALQAGHEIKNPISAINIHSELLREHIGDKEYLEKYIDLVRRNSEKVEILLQRMKEFVLGKSEEKEFNLVDMLNDKVLFLLNGNLSKKEIKVIKNFPDKIVMLADEQALERALVNIIINAIDSMDMHGTLTVSASSDEKSAYIVVADTGCGIKEEDLSRIFLPLFTTRSNGTGLGLSIAFRTITVDHNGKLDVESQVGKGTTIKIQLPLKHLQKN